MGRNQGAAGAANDWACVDAGTDESDSTTNGSTSVQVTVAEPAPVPAEILPMKRNADVTLPISLTSPCHLFHRDAVSWPRTCASRIPNSLAESRIEATLRGA